MRKIFIKTFSWEYWPIWIVYFPVSFYYIYLSLKAKSFFFFSAANPTIENGGMFFESKWKIFEMIPGKYLPPTIFIEENETIEIITEKMKSNGISFPVIAKPNRGERGWGVKKITSIEELNNYVQNVNIEFIIQSYISAPLEFSVFYYRHPKSSTGKITSVTFKKLLSVTGDGISTIDQLVRKCNRSYLQYAKLKKSNSLLFEKIPGKNKEHILVPYGNHVLGAKFINYNHIIDSKLTETFVTISNEINGFHFGRFDLRCNSVEDLKAGKNISILELNGAGAEPSHIYDPEFSFLNAQFVLAKHYKMMYEAAIENNKNGIRYMTYGEFRHTRRKESQYKNKIQLECI